MKLDVKQLEQIAWGAAYVCEEDGGVSFHRFTREQEALYARTDTAFYKKCMAPAGIRLVFRTDSRSLAITASVSLASVRQYFSIDVFTDGTHLGSIDNHSGVTLPQAYTTVELPQGRFSGTFDLGEGEKTVMIYLPWARRTVLEDFSLEDGASVIPVKRQKQLLVYGDSITQGYDALYSCHRYAALLADSLDAEEHNKAIGGEVFFPALAAEPDEITPDYVTVAYGTNDWGKVTKEAFDCSCETFYRTLSAKYPNARIFALTPIWRKDIGDFDDRGPFTRIAERIREVTAALPNVTVIEGWELVPADEAYYADLRLHPNDRGFAEYHKNLWEAIKSQL